MKRSCLIVLALLMAAGAAWAQGANVDPGWDAFVIRLGGVTSAPGNIVDRPDLGPGVIEIQTWETGQKLALGTNALNGARVSQIGSLHIDRLDVVEDSGSLYGPYFNLWVTDGAGHYAVLANEPSDAEWTADRWYVPDWNFLKTKLCKVYETTGLVGTSPGTSWVAGAVGSSGVITFEAAANLIITSPPPSYFTLPGTGVGTGAPRELGTNVAYGFNWMFGDTAANYVSGTGPGFILDNYYALADYPVTNVTQGTGYFTIQAAVDAANAGDAITVAAGHYVEQVHVTVDNLSITGAGVGTTFIDSPVTLPLSFTTSAVNKAVVFVDNADGVALADLTVDGLGRGNSNYRFQGIAYWNAGGSLTGVRCTHITETPFSGNQHGNAIYAVTTDATSHALALTDVQVDDFQKTGVVISGAGLSGTLLRVDVTGRGATPITAQNGIQVSGGATADATDCDVTGVAYTGALNYTATGLLVYGPATANFDACTVDGCQTSVYFIDAVGSFDNGQVVNPLGDALYVYSDQYGKSLDVARPLAQPFDPGQRGADKAATSVSLTGSSFVGTDLTNSWGPSAYTDDDVTFVMDDCEVAHWDYGIVLYNTDDAVFDATVTGCNIHDNGAYGLYSNADQTVAASCNWWGDDSGPNVPGNPSPGDNLEGDVTFQPWLDAPGGDCVLYGDNNIGVGNAAICLTPANTCVTVPVTFNRLDATATRGVSVTIQLSPNLVLCTGDPLTDVAMASGPGSWLGSYTNEWTEVLDNGGGSYTIDRAVTGSPCGPTNGGLLFTVNVAKAPSVTTDQIGTVSVTAVDVRDCDNASLACLPGAVGNVSINLSIPAALTGLTATQVKTGNDSDGTTKINLAWTAPGGDAALIDLWRKGYGDYPEYNDGTGATPAAPVTAGNGWTHVATVSATTTAKIDEPPTRDFWSYAAFVTDACGNVSAASAITGGTLNYHLGDVVPTNNLVGTSDISDLGWNYGSTLAPYGDPHNYLDVGPTTDRSVNARPTTDNRIQFEDLMVFAMNYDLVSKAFPTATPAAGNAIALVSDRPGSVGTTFDVAIRLSGDGRLQGVSVPLVWNAAVATPIGMQPGNLLSGQGDLALVLSPEPGTVDAALLGLRDQGIAGDGVLATVTFRVNGAGDPMVGLGQVSGRDKDNQAVLLSGAGNSLPPASLPAVSELHANVPNPFNPATEFSFVLSQSGPVSLRVYTLRGELVRTLVAGDMVAGAHSLTWNGLDDQGRQAASGGYIVRFVAPDRTQTRNITLLK